MKGKIIRISTAPISLNVLLKGQLRFLNKYFHIIALSGGGSDLNEVANREDIEIYGLKMSRQISLANDFSSLVKLYFFFKKVKPLIVHSITPKAGLLSMIAAKLAGVPIRIHTFTGLVFPTKRGVMKRLLIVMDRLLCLCATNIYPEGRGVRDDLLNYNITSKPLKVLANGNVNGIDVEYFNIAKISESVTDLLKRKLLILDNDFVFIFVGRLVGDKGINELIPAFSALNKEHPFAKLLLVGPFESDLDPLKPHTLKEMVSNPNVKVLGYQDDVRPYFAISDCLVFPSYREGFPNVVMQAGAMGLPSIVSDINGCNEIIVQSKNGIIIPPKDVESLFKAMLQFVENRNWMAEMKKNARGMIVKRYEQQIVWDALLDEYKRLEENVQKLA